MNRNLNMSDARTEEELTTEPNRWLRLLRIGPYIGFLITIGLLYFWVKWYRGQKNQRQIQQATQPSVNQQPITVQQQVIVEQTPMAFQQ